MSRTSHPRSSPETGRSYWQRHAGAPLAGACLTEPALLGTDPAPPAPWPATTDFAVIGGGLAGLMTSICLAEVEPAADIVVLESAFAGFGASGRNGGLMSPLAAPVWLVTAQSNPDHAWALRQLNQRAHEAASWLHQHAPESEIKPINLCLKSAGRLTAAGLKRVARAVEHCRLEHAINEQDGQVSLEIPTHVLQPYRTARELAVVARRLGIDVREHCKVATVSETAQGIEVQLTDGRSLRAAKAIICTNAYTRTIKLPKKARAKVVYNFMIATPPLEPQALDRLPTGQTFVVELNRNYVFYREHAGRLVFGGIDRFSPPGEDDFAVPPKVLAGLERLLDLSFPGTRLEAAEAWSGCYHATSTELPHIEQCGATGAIIMNVGYGGTGVALALICARLVAGLARDGHPPDPDDRRLLDTITSTRTPVWSAAKFGLQVASRALASSLSPTRSG